MPLSLLIVYSGYLIIIGNEIKTTGYIVYSIYLIGKLNKHNMKPFFLEYLIKTTGTLFLGYLIETIVTFFRISNKDNRKLCFLGYLIKTTGNFVF